MVSELRCATTLLVSAHTGDFGAETVAVTNTVNCQQHSFFFFWNLFFIFRFS